MPAEIQGEVLARATPVPSLIAGRGLQATEAIASGEAVARFATAPVAVADLGPLNHSCEPNLGWRDEHTLVTMRDVAAGAELTVDYATVMDDPDLALWCHCETYRCRQVIEGTDWRIPQLQKRYAGWWSPRLQGRIDEQAG